MSKKSEKIKNGDVFSVNRGGSVTVVEYRNCAEVIIKNNDDHGHVESVSAYNLRKGIIKNPYYPSVAGVGYMGVGIYSSRKDGKTTKAYTTWTRMLDRCYNPKRQIHAPTYIGCTVDTRWHNFQTFAEWFYNQYRGERYDIDKDIINKGNKIYSPESVVFVPHDINSMMTTSTTARGALPVGVTRHQDGYRSAIKINNRMQHIGCHRTPEEAFYAYKEFKENYIKERANFYHDVIDPRAYDALMAYTVDITD